MKVLIFLGFLYLYRKKVVWIVGWNLDCVMDESVDFSGFDDIWCDIGIFNKNYEKY